MLRIPRGIVFLTITVVFFAAQSVLANDHPNILLILADDLGYGDVGCYNPKSRIPTPNLDQMARQGMQFLDAHSPCTVCTPTRYSLMTGQMAFRVPGGGRVFTGAGGPSLIAKDRLTIADMLKKKGYRTACVGKWHIGLTFFDKQGLPIHKGGLEAVKRVDFSRRIDGGPLDCGFDTFFGTACCPTTDWLYSFIEDDKIVNPPKQVLDRTGLPKHPYAVDNRRGMVSEDFDLESVDLKFLEKSREFLKAHKMRSNGKPFFLFHSTQAVHLPSFPEKSFQGKTEAGPHGDFIFELDFVVGELLKTLKELELDQDTLVIFTSDNGPEVLSVYHMRHDHDHDGARPWRGMKRDNWEGGHRVPFLVKWPGKIKPGSKTNQVTSLTDVMATVADIVDFELPKNSAEDSFSMLPVLRQKTSLQETTTNAIRPYLLMQGFGGSRYLAIRKDNWKYLAHKGSGGNNYEKGRFLKEYFLEDNAPESKGQLYDLSKDPGEKKNLALEHANVARQMQSLLERSIRTGRSRPLE